VEEDEMPYEEEPPSIESMEEDLNWLLSIVD
jgi:hypothetical protein